MERNTTFPDPQNALRAPYETDTEGRCIWCADDHDGVCNSPERAAAYAELYAAELVWIGGAA